MRFCCLGSEDSDSEDVPGVPSTGRLVYGGAKAVLALAEKVAEGPPLVKTVISPLIEILRIIDEVLDNKDNFGTTLSRLEGLQKSFEAPVESDPGEKTRRSLVNAKLGKVLDGVKGLQRQGLVPQVLNSADNKKRISDYIGEIRQIITEYQLALQQTDHGLLTGLVTDNQLSKLSPTPNAWYEALGARRDKINECLAGTRVDTISTLETWLAEDSDHPIFWLRGRAGMGKSTISMSVAQYARAEAKLAASFFCSRDNDGTRDIRRVFPTVAYQLCFRIQGYRELLNKELSDMSGAVQGAQSLDSQFSRLILEPLAHLDPKDTRPYVIVLDALDELEHNEILSPIIEVLLRHIPEFIRLGLKIFVTSRPVDSIQSAYSHSQNKEARKSIQVLDLADIPDPIVLGDIRTYVQAKLAKVAYHREAELADSGFPKEEEVEAIVKQAGTLFIFAFTVCQLIETSTNSLPSETIQQFVATQSEDQDGALDGLYSLYDRIFQDAFRRHGDKINAKTKEGVQFTVISVALLFQNLSLPGLARLLLGQASDTAIRLRLKHMHSVLVVPDPGDKAGKVYAYHKSFVDYIADEGNRVETRGFSVHPPSHHAELALLCFRVMKDLLVEPNICKLEPNQDYAEIADLETRRANNIPEALEYACRFWAHHLAKTRPTARLVDALREFAEVRMLRWIEVLAIVCGLDQAVSLLVAARKWLSQADSAMSIDLTLVALLGDGERFILDFYDTISDSSLQTYISALPFTPKSSVIFQKYKDEYHPGGYPMVNVLQGIDQAWNARLRTILTGSDITCVDISNDSSSLVYGTTSGRLYLYDMSTGGLDVQLGGHDDEVACVAFLGSKYLRSVSKDGVSRSWDLPLGTASIVDMGKRCSVGAISPDGMRLAVVSEDKKSVSFWRWSEIFESGLGGSLAQMPSPGADAEEMHYIRLHRESEASEWGYEFVERPTNHSDSSDAPGNSQDEGRIALSRIVRLRHSQTSDWDYQIMEGPLDDLGDPLRPRSPSGAHIDVVEVSNAMSRLLPQIVQDLGVQYEYTRLTFSPDGSKVAVGTNTGSVDIYHLEDHTKVDTIDIPLEYISCVAWSRSNFIACGDGRQEWHSDKNVYVFPAEAGAQRLLRLHPDESWSGRDYPSPGYPAWVAWLPDNTKLAVGYRSTKLVYDCDDPNIRVYDVDIQQHAWKMRAVYEGHSQLVGIVIYSPDGTRMVSGTNQYGMIWDAHHAHGFPRIGHTSGSRLESLIISPDGSTAASAGFDQRVLVWDTDEGTLQSDLRDRYWILSLSFSPDGRMIASGVQDGWTRVYRAAAGIASTVFEEADKIELYEGPSHHGIPSSAFTKDLRHLAVGEERGRVLIFDLEATDSDPLELTYHPRGDSVHALAWSPSGTLASSSWPEGGIHLQKFDGEKKTPSDWHRFLAPGDTLPPFSAIAFSRDETRVAAVSGARCSILLFDVETARILGKYACWKDVYDLAFSPDESQIFTGYGVYDIDNAGAITLSTQVSTAIATSGPPARKHTYHMSPGNWIRDVSGRRICRLPPSSDGARFLSYGHKVVVGESNGNVIILHVV
ncbi:WD40 repeat-like protein [Artomyces pyxidatus]|uniref:WD40 repeat-like protein n=1 Tax=Artomyces pyxidatus TaxID=48021 RepID=A0ACB8SYZ5_9AGAM|nr:WD40 repeat-like protein [Artomyces pyxidatus]